MGARLMFCNGLINNVTSEKSSKFYYKEVCSKEGAPRSFLRDVYTYRRNGIGVPILLRESEGEQK